MYKKTNPQQSLFGVETQLPPSLRSRLKRSWAHLFRIEVLPILLRSEDRFSLLYGKTGRPNFSVARMLGLCFLQELYNLSDQQALDTFGFDSRWHYALNVTPSDSYLSRRSLVEFRRRLAEVDPDMAIIRSVFDDISKTAIDKLGVSTIEQRIDSTHITSNIRTRGRFDLIRKTIELFISSLDEENVLRIPATIRDSYDGESNGWFGRGGYDGATKLEEIANDLYELIVLFADIKKVIASEPYQLLVRLLSEHCEVIDEFDKGETGDSKKVRIKKRSAGVTLQSPYDPDASYGHKGKGYSAHITETCNNKCKREIITDYEVHGAACPDVGKAEDAVDRLASTGLQPQTLYADGGYPSVPSAYNIQEKGVEFMAPVNRKGRSSEMIGRDRFIFDEDGFAVRCPAQHKPLDHRMRSANNRKGRCSLHAIFDGNLCRTCSKLELCPVKAPSNRKRGCKRKDAAGNFRLEITAQLVLRDKMYVEQQTDRWKQRYKIRSGVEATMSELKRVHGLGRLRVRRLAKVSFAVACKVIACNIKRWSRCYAAFVLHIMSCLQFIWSTTRGRRPCCRTSG